MENQILIVDDEYTRAAYTRCAEIAAKLNEMFGAGILIQPGDLLTEQIVTNGQSTYQFPLLQQEIQNGTYPLSYGVQQNDVFIAPLGELTLDNRAAGSPLVYPQTYYNQLVFTAANTTTPAHIQAFFNGVIKYAVGSRTFIQRMFTRKFLRQPRTQQSAANNYPEYMGNNLVRLVPYLVISGKATNTLSLTTLPVTAFAPGGIDSQNVASFYMQGFTLQNGAGYGKFFTGDLSVESYYAAYIEQNKGLARPNYKPLKAAEDFSSMT